MQLHEDKLFDNRYLLKKMLGCGGFSEVWLVEDIKVGHKKMALKVYVPDKGLDDDGIKLFSNEFELVFDFNHTHLLRPAHFDVSEHSPYLLMPYCEQGSASKLIGHISEEEAWQFLHDVSSGLAFLHAQNPPIIHQDIKPDNILKDNLGHYQITDFGISAKARSTLRKSVSAVKSGGTMAYMPPERFGKENAPIKASDVWAVGATLYELLAGDTPFGEHGGLMQKSGADIPNLPGKRSRELQEIIARCLQKEPWDRPVAQQIVEWTEEHLRGEKIVFDKKTKKKISTVKKVLSGTGVGVASLLVAFAVVWFIVPLIKKDEPEPQIITAISSDKTPGQVAAGSEVPVQATDSISSAESGATSGSQVSSGSAGAATTPVSQTSVPNGAPAQTASATPATTTPAVTAPPAWLSEYDRILNAAQSAYGNRDYVRAKQEYNRALTLANRNGDRPKATFVSGQIAECDIAIEAARKVEEERRQKETQERLAAYNYVGNFALGTEYLVVQRKSDNRWGVIRKDGSEAEAFNYLQVSVRLKDGYYALRNEQGWVVFDTRLRKVASGLEKLDDYR